MRTTARLTAGLLLFRRLNEFAFWDVCGHISQKDHLLIFFAGEDWQLV
jgi:hypothetical protein